MAAPFKAYDIRGLVGRDLTPERAHAIGLALAREIFAAPDAPENSIVVSRDMRTHSPEMSRQLMRGLCDGGCDCIDIGLAPTPMNYWANNHFHARGSVMVTASHNGAQYNGFKVSGPRAVPIDYASGLDRVEARVRQFEAKGLPELDATRGTVTQVPWPLDAYLDWMDGFLTRDGRAMTIGVDTANGMGGFFLPDWFARRSWLRAVPLFWELDGTFPNHEADPLKPENLLDVQQLVRDNACDFGAAFDGDADRCMFVDENGAAISSDLITALIAAEVLASVPDSPILYDLRSSRVVPEWIAAHGGQPLRERVGHSFMKRLMRRSGARFGGELSGHYYFADCFDTDSGLMALVQIVNILQKSGQPLSQLIAPLRRYSATGELNFEVSDPSAALRSVEASYAARGAALDHLDGLTVTLDDWWFNLRPSNTEPLLRLNLEAPDVAARDAHLNEVRALIESNIAVEA